MTIFHRGWGAALACLCFLAFPSAPAPALLRLPRIGVLLGGAGGLLWCLLACLFLPTAVPVSADTQTVTIGDPANPGALAQALQDAYTGGARHIVIKPGYYALPEPPGGSTFLLQGWKDATISAYGVTLMIMDLNYGHRCFQMTDCARITLEGPTISQVSQVMYQGRILSLGTDAKGNETCVWKPDAGYPIPPADATQFTYPCEPVDQHTRRLKVGVQGFNRPPMANLGDGTYQITFDRPNVGLVVGDWLVGRGPGHDPFKVYLENCRDCTVKNVTLLRNGFSAIRESSGGGNHLLGDKWLTGPPPAGGTEVPLFCCSADGFHSTLTNPGPDVENCVFQGLLDDDCIAIHGAYQDIQSVSGASFVISNHNNYSGLAVGQPARIDNETFYAEATVTALHDNGDGTTTVTLDKDYHIPADSAAFNPLACGPGYKIINCILGNTRSRGILAKADNGLIRGNTVYDCGISAMQIGSDWFKGEAGYSKNVMIENNTIHGNGAQTGGGLAAIWIGTQGVMENRNFIIRNNKVDHFTGLALHIQGADGVQVLHNVFADPIVTSGSKGHVVGIAQTTNLTLTGNVVTGLPPSVAGELWTVDAVSTNLVGLSADGLKNEKSKN